MYRSIVEAVYIHAKQIPEKLCIIDDKSVYTYGEVWKLANMEMHRLRMLGISRQNRVLVECTQDARFLIIDLACELCGAIFVPIEQGASEERVCEIIKDTDAQLFICNTQYNIPIQTISVELMLQDDIEFKEECLFPLAEDSTEILYTTGTTGISKGIEITNGNNIALAENVKYGTEMKESNIELIPLPLSHSHGLRCCYANLLNGSTVVLIDGILKVKYMFELIKKYRVTAMDLSPSAILILDRLSKGELANISSQIDYIQVGTEALSEDVKELLIAYFPDSRLYNFYGSTESGRTCVLDFNRDRKGAGCIGRPTCNAKFIVTDDDRNLIVSSKENVGLLASAGLMNMKGYWRQDELTRSTMENGYIYSNDIGYIDEEGFIYVLGRKGDVINYKGVKIAPSEIEASVRKFAGILDCACIPKKDAIAGQVPKLFVVVEKNNEFHEDDLFRFMEKHIEVNKMPKEIEIIDEIPRTYNGKICRAKLIDREENM